MSSWISSFGRISFSCVMVPSSNHELLPQNRIAASCSFSQLLCKGRRRTVIWWQAHHHREFASAKQHACNTLGIFICSCCFMHLHHETQVFEMAKGVEILKDPGLFTRFSWMFRPSWPGRRSGAIKGAKQGSGHSEGPWKQPKSSKIHDLVWFRTCFPHKTYKPLAFYRFEWF